MLTGNFFGSYRGKHNEFVVLVNLDGGDKQPVLLAPGDFKTGEGESLASWQNVNVLSLRAYYKKERQVDRQQELGGQPSPI